MRTLLILLLFPVWLTQARAEDWRSDKHGISMTLPDGPLWTPFGMDKPSAIVGRGRENKTGMFVLSAKPYAGKETEFTAALAKKMASAAPSNIKVGGIEPMTIDGVIACRIETSFAPAGKPVFLDMVQWIRAGQIYTLTLSSPGAPKENAEFNALIKSIRMAKK